MMLYFPLCSFDQIFVNSIKCICIWFTKCWSVFSGRCAQWLLTPFSKLIYTVNTIWINTLERKKCTLFFTTYNFKVLHHFRWHFLIWKVVLIPNIEVQYYTWVVEDQWTGQLLVSKIDADCQIQWGALRSCSNSFMITNSSSLQKKTSQELRMLSAVTLNCQVTKIVINSGSQLSEL